MIRKAIMNAVTMLIMLLSCYTIIAQISPGELSKPHSNLDGISNCTKCHVLGNKISNEKCLGCHSEILSRINNLKGYHSSAEVKGKQCFSCHSEHNGKNFQLVRIDESKFDHSLTGYNLSVPHAKQGCKECHSARYIADPKLKSKKSTYLGVSPECLNCHADYHLRTLSSTCLNCHNTESFTPASKFNHDDAKFKLAGQHLKVDCIKCHKIDMTDGKKFQHFRGIEYTNCTSCHKDPHQNQFGQNCRQCHSEESFHVVSGIKNFDHNKTDFKLEDKHLIVNCKACHKTKFTDPLKHDKCTDCHSDYHNKQFVNNGVAPDCSQCHNVKGFTLFSFSVDDHNMGPFPLRGAHSAVPCYECHKKQDKWSFRKIGINCNDCHPDVHQNFIQTKYYPDANCIGCHKETRWSDVLFDHSKTQFALTGAHETQNCRACHFRPDEGGKVQQKFSGLSQSCSACHADKHRNQFEKNGVTNCTECHGTSDWKASRFDHNKTNFKLDGKHVNVACGKCHKPQQTGSDQFVLYKIKDYKCESCHL
jgi:hypothetical protein